MVRTAIYIKNFALQGCFNLCFIFKYLKVKIQKKKKKKKKKRLKKSIIVQFLHKKEQKMTKKTQKHMK